MNRPGFAYYCGYEIPAQYRNEKCVSCNLPFNLTGHSATCKKQSERSQLLIAVGGAARRYPRSRTLDINVGDGRLIKMTRYPLRNEDI